MRSLLFVDAMSNFPSQEIFTNSVPLKQHRQRMLSRLIFITRFFIFMTGLSIVTPAHGDDKTAKVVDTPQFTAEQIDFFESRVRPVLVQHCYECHSTDAAKLQAGLYVDSREAILEGGESGAVVVVGKPEESLLISAVKYQGNEMPPDRKLEQREIDALSKWVEMGAPWPQVTSLPGAATTDAKTDWTKFDWTHTQQSHWAWKPVERPVVPVVDSATPAAAMVNPIDHFVIARRSQAGLHPAQPAAMHVLARRIYLDLIGIPPTPQQLQSFITAATLDRPNAVKSLVNALLDSPMYGQRWGRYWLDVARFSDGRGGFLEGDKPLDDAWRYRDWVVDALNNDLPINDFFRMQIAGDLSGNPSDAIATGFFALGPTYQSDGGDPDSIAQSRAETLDDRVDILTRGLLGITGSCARCHDHKFDPIPQQDYYSLAGVFNNSANRVLPLAPSDVVERHNAHKRAVDELTKKIKSFKKKPKKANKENAVAAENDEAAPEDESQLERWKVELAELEKNAPPAVDTAHTLHDTGNEDMKVALRGNLRKTGDLAPRRFLRVISGAEPVRFKNGSGRAELAATVIDPRNPLTARVFVNRIWQHHFGAGLVRTPSNFGTLGERPTHPELLDWLASEFVANGWSLKMLHRTIMNSATYQLGGEYQEQAYKADGDNRTLWRISPRRMDVEAWRDSLLSVTGELDSSLGGPPIHNIVDSNRRTLYAKVGRNGDVFGSDVFLRLFDFPLMRATVEQRPSSIVPQQFLFFMNSSFMIDRAKALVGRLHRMSDSDEERIGQAYEMLYARRPESHELEIGLNFIREVRDGGSLSNWDRYAQVLISSNEFMFVR
ncbi:MAG: PSD1 and planctomycete cytochrome C domain-containing protein [Pirellula sp.]